MVFKKGHIPWNNGLTGIFDGKKNPMYGRHHTEETKGIQRKQKLGKTYEQIYGKEGAKKLKEKRKKQQEGKKVSNGTRKKQSEIRKKMWRDGVYGSPEYIKKLSIAHIGLQAGEKNPRWRGGISFEPYGIGFNKQLKKTIRQRDNYTCQLCGNPQGKNKLCVHHRDYNKRNNTLKNLIPLCKSCHGKTGIKRNYWINIFSNI